MLLKTYCAQLLFCICFLNFVITNVFSVTLLLSPQASSIQLSSCQDVTKFLRWVSFMSPSDALNMITAPLACPICPPKLKSLRQYLILQVKNNVLNINGIMAGLRRTSPGNKYDLLITTLMAINEFTNIRDVVKSDISDAILYFLKIRYLGINNFPSVRKGFCYHSTYPTFVTPAPPASSPSSVEEIVIPLNHPCVCQTKAVEILLKRLIELESRRISMQCGNPNFYIPMTKSPPSPINIVESNIAPQQPLNMTKSNIAPTLPLGNMLQLIPVPLYSMEKQIYEKFKSLLMSNEVQQIIKGMNLSLYPTDIEKLQAIITKVLQVTTSREILEVFNFYRSITDMKNLNFNIGSLIEGIHLPQNPKEESYYTIIKQLLTGDQLYKLKLSPNFTQAQTVQDKLIILFNELLASNILSPEFAEAVQYYLNILTAQKQNIEFSNLARALPKPSSEEESKQFAALQNILKNNELYTIMKNINLVNLTEQQRLTLLLHELITKTEYKQWSEVATYYRNLLAMQKYHFNYFDLLNNFATIDEIQPHVRNLREYFYTPEFESILSQLNLLALSERERLIVILEAIVANSKNAQVVESSKFLLQVLQQQGFYENINNLIILIPVPQTDNERLHYTTVVNFLKSQQSYQLLHHIDFSSFAEKKLLLDLVIKTILESNVDAHIKDAFEYYVDEELRDFELVTQKEIKGNFKLKDIFDNTLNRNTMTLSQKNAFKRFFKFISDTNRNAISSFTSWDQAKTQGEFTKLLFKHLLDSASTPPEIKDSILELDPIVNMQGPGALPP